MTEQEIKEMQNENLALKAENALLRAILETVSYAAEQAQRTVNEVVFETQAGTLCS